VAAEIARIEGYDVDAAQLYEQSIRFARDNGFVHHEALALELAAHFYAARGFDRIAKAYVRDARSGYRQWGADGKVRQLEEQYPYLADEQPSSDPTRTVLARIEHLDLSTVLKVSQTVQGETDLEKLIAAVMRLSVEHAGAERGLLILPHGDAYRIEAEARSSNERVTVNLGHATVVTGDVPQSVLQYVVRTRERVLLQDASTSQGFADDEYLRRHHARSVLCIPLLKQTRLTGIIYLENNLTSGAFTPARMSLLEVLASDAAISLENARLYRDLQEREARVRRLIDANLIGISIWHADGRILDANDEFLRIIGYDRVDLVSGRLCWSDLIPAESRELELRVLEKVRAGGDQKPEERELLRKDGSRVPVLAGGTTFAGALDEGVGFMIDRSEQKRVEDERRHAAEELRRSEADLHEAQRLSRTGSWKLDFSSGAVRVSPEVLRIFAVQSDENTSSPDFWFDRIHHEDRHRVREHFERCIAQRVEYEADYRLVLPDGSVRFQHAVGHPVVDESGALREFLGTAMDVTEQVQARVALENALREITRLKDRLSDENLALKEEVARASMFEEIVGTSPALQPVLSRVGKVARSDSTVLITGETGTGKELVARAIHRRSARAALAFVSVNCAAVPRELIASELFGHEKGAFTGATQRRLGRFELAHGGTIFLDEVGELPMETQVALLRVLQEREFERVGGSAPVRADVRVIAATNRDLQAAIEAGIFRSDLFYRLNVFPIAVPALRDRADDIPLLVEYFIDRYARKAGKALRRISKRTLDHLRSYPWPGNVRELQNVIERSVIVCDTDEFTVDESWLSARPAIEDSLALSGTVAAHEKARIEDALQACRGRVYGPAGAAVRLGISRSTLESKIRSLRINKNRFRP
jgi:PAS domain S-box-containing protein